MIYNDYEIDRIMDAGLIVSEAFKLVQEAIKPGVSTLALNDLVHAFIIKNKAIPAPLNYTGSGTVPFPKSICTSINNVACHGIPSKNDILKEGDIVKVDITAIYRGYHADSCKTFIVSPDKSPKKVHNLVDGTLKALNKAIGAVECGKMLSSIGKSIETVATESGFSVVKNYIGHGVGKKFHEPPEIYHFYQPNDTSIFVPGMVFTIEPIFSMGSPETVVGTDSWTVTTKDNSLTAQFEHTIAILENGEVITVT